MCKLHHCSAIEIFENLVDRTRVAFGGTLVEKQAVLSEFLRMFCIPGVAELLAKAGNSNR